MATDLGGLPVDASGPRVRQTQNGGALKLGAVASFVPAFDDHDRLVMDAMICTDCVEIRLRGELDVATGPLLGRQLAEIIERKRPAQVVVDLHELAFMDSSGLTTLIRARRQLESFGRLVLDRATPIVQRVLELSGVRDYIDVRFDADFLPD